MNRTLVVAALLSIACEGRIGLPPGEGEPVEVLGAGGGVEPGPFAVERPSCTGRCLGTTGLTRITSLEFQNSISDVFGIAAPADALPGDGEVAGAFFSNDQRVLAGSEVDLYRQTAEEVATAITTQSAVLDRLVSALGTACHARNGTCADAFVARYGGQLYRRPLTPEERSDYRALYDWAVKPATDPDFVTGGSGTFADAIGYLVERLLQSPGFLYRLEVGTPTKDHGVVQLTSYEVAARLAAFLLRSVPDEELQQAAEADALRSEEGIARQVERITHGPRGDRLWTGFAREWISTGQIADSQVRDLPEAQANWSDAVANGLELDVQQTFLHLIQTDGTVHTLLTSSGGVEQGAQLQWITGSGGAKGTWNTQLPNRRGLLSWPGLLIANGHPGFTHAHQRGLWVRGKLLCQTIPSPPANLADAIAAAQQAEQNMPSAKTDRERMTALTEVNAVCRSCHHMTNPIGYGLDEYDELGRFRTSQVGTDGASYPIDQSGEITGLGPLASDANGAFTDGSQLIDRLADSATVARCMERQLARYALQREVTGDDQPSLDAAYEKFDAQRRDLRTLVGLIASTDAFRYRRLTPR
ncbi:MAG: DUF1588 domain-containing protein [Myxococcaceae bacterium]